MNLITTLGSRGVLAIFGTLTVIVGAIYFEIRQHEAQRRSLVQAAAAGKVAMLPAPIPKDWIIEGTPNTEMYNVATTFDDSVRLFIWRTSAGKFKWIYDSDEIVTILDGEVHIVDDKGHEQHLKAGDVALLPAGATTIWTVPHHVLKSGTIKRSLPSPLEVAVRWMRTVKGWFVPKPVAAI